MKEMKKILLLLVLSLGYMASAQTDFLEIGTFDNNCSSFYPLPGEKYIISAWVKEEHNEQQKSYTNGALQVSFHDGESISPMFPAMTMQASGYVIEGWQRIVGIVTIPLQNDAEVTPKQIVIKLVCGEGTTACYFDDIRVFPYNGSMKSFVYDKDTQRLMAELDENNYATYYEYDNEGGLVRVKKETEKGVYTIQETRSSSAKQ